MVVVKEDANFVNVVNHFLSNNTSRPRAVYCRCCATEAVVVLSPHYFFRKMVNNVTEIPRDVKNSEFIVPREVSQVLALSLPLSLPRSRYLQQRQRESG